MPSFLRRVVYNTAAVDWSGLVDTIVHCDASLLPPLSALAAAVCGNVDVLRAVHERLGSVALAVADADGQTALHWACRYGERECIEYLLRPVDRGDGSVDAGIRERDRFGRTPLHAAAESGAVDAIDSLLTAGADVAARCDAGMTPAATAREHKHIVAALVLRAGMPAGDTTPEEVGGRRRCVRRV
jgi:hypothetical protein